MKTDSVKENQSSRLETYKTIINGIEFMEEYIQDPDILSSNSNKSKRFLMQSFSYLHPDFHYLSFLKPENLDMEIIKAARVLQILPVNTSNKLSDVLKNDAEKFWDRFFSLFKNKKEISAKKDSIFAIGWEDKVSFFKDMKGTLNYLNYEFPVLDGKKLNNSDIDEELNNWKKLAVPTYINNDESVSLSRDAENITNIETVIKSKIAETAAMHVMINTLTKPDKLEYLEFFDSFISWTKNILEYKKNISIITSIDFNYLYGKMLLNSKFLENLYFIKKCLKLVKTLKSKQYT